MRTTPTRTKIIATVGPASSSKNKLWELYMAGVQVFRLNFSHGAHEDHLEVINNIRELNDRHNANITILQDLQGPKIRTRNVEGGEVLLEKNAEVRISTEDRESTAAHITTSYKYLLSDVSEGDMILIDDGKIELKVTAKNEDALYAKVKYGGVLRSHKGINLPDSEVSESSMTEKDLQDLEFGIKHNVDWVALSFVRRANDIVALKEILKKHGSDIKVIAKLEKPQAIDRLDEIIEVSDALMVARGDLGVEVLMEDVPMIQKLIVEKCNQAAKPVIIATQMMESMISSPRPTRAESNDVANAILDGADAVMLSAETAVGQYPIETVQSMCRTIREMEDSDSIYFLRFDLNAASSSYYNDSVILSGCSLAKYTKAAAIVGMTNSGYTALRLATHRPKSRIFIFTNNRRLLTQLGLVWGVDVYYYNEYRSTDDTIADIKIFLVSNNLIQKGDVLINTGSMPINEKKRTNMVKLSVI